MHNALPESVQKIVNAINKKKKVDSDILTGLLVDAGLQIEDMMPFSYFDHPDHESYGRRFIYGNDRYKILLMSWRCGDFTAIHDHGVVEWGCVYFFGKATHRTYILQNGVLTLKESKTFHRGQVTSLHGEFIHMMGNSGPGNLMSLHIYGSDTGRAFNGQHARVFALEHGKIYHTAGEAYLNMPDGCIKGQELLPEIDTSSHNDYKALIQPFYDRIQSGPIHRKAVRLSAFGLPDKSVSSRRFG